MRFVPKAEDRPEKFDGQILVPFPVESALSGVMKRIDNVAERLWYRRTFTVPKEWTGKNVLLHFGAVNWDSTVWVNGKKLGDHRGGYDGFDFDITDALKPDGEQEIVVSAWNPTDAGTQPRGKQVRKPGGIFYTPTHRHLADRLARAGAEDGASSRSRSCRTSIRSSCGSPSNCTRRPERQND